MDYKILRTDRIFETFKKECASKRMWWSDFIDSKDLGIRYDYPNTYFILDQNKWALAKIKYGF